MTEPSKGGTATSLLKGKSRSSFTRYLLRQIIKKRSGFHPSQPILVKRPIQYSNKLESRRNLRKHRRSAAKQHLYDAKNEATSKPVSNWRSTFNFMLRHTRNVGETLNFRVVIGKGVAAEAHDLLSAPDTNLSQICKRNESHIHIEEVNHKTRELILNLTGSEDAVRKSLLDIVGLVGKITAIRVSDRAWESLLMDVWEGASEKRPSIRLLGNGKAAVDDKTMTVQSSFSNASKYKSYTLTRRADEILRPTEWNKNSFEKYVAALVHGRVPTHLARSLYPNHPDHQETVVSLLLDLFTSDHTRSEASISALKMAINFIESRGSGFRQASRTIFQQAELSNLPRDHEIFNIFLVSASKARDLNGFDSILRLMVRKGYHPQSRAWAALMEMIEKPTVKRFIASKLRNNGLNRNPAIHHAIGRQMAMIDLEQQLSTELDISKFINGQNEKYGVGWLDTMTLNRIMSMLGAHTRGEARDALLELVYTTRIASPDVVTLNTMLTHATGLPQQVAMMQGMFVRWPNLGPRLAPDAITYHLLFRAAWKRRFPNLLRVVWRYAALAKSTTPKMRYTMKELLQKEKNLSAHRALLKAWEDVIFGQAELAEMRARHPDTLNAMHMISKYLELAKGMRPSVGLATKLEEALSMDVKIHRLLKDGAVMTASMRESLSVEIPLEPKPMRKPGRPTFD